MDDTTRDQIARALGRIPSGCAILTASSKAGRTGMLASWIMQAGFEPPSVSVAIKKGRPIEGVVKESGAFVMNLVGENRSPMFKHFANGFAPGEDAFAGMYVQNIPQGVVIQDQVGWLACRVTGTCDAGDHVIYVAKVESASADGEGRPYVHVRKNGLGY